MKITTRRKTSDQRDTTLAFHTVLGITCGYLPYLPHTPLFPFYTQYTLNTVRGPKSREVGTDEFRRVTSVTVSPPCVLRSLQGDLCLSYFVIYAYIPFRNQRNWCSDLFTQPFARRDTLHSTSNHR